MDIFKLLFNANIINPRMDRCSLNIRFICKRPHGFIFFVFGILYAQKPSSANIPIQVIVVGPGAVVYHRYLR